MIVAMLSEKKKKSSNHLFVAFVNSMLTSVVMKTVVSEYLLLI